MKDILTAVTSILCCIVMFLCPAMVVVGAEIDAKALYKEHCTPCHGVDGRGTDLGKGLAAMAEGIEFPDFNDPEWQKRTTDERMIEQITNGSPGRMFSFKEKMNGEEMKAVVVYVRGFPSR
ncbi:MAG: cytochrome c [Candidatus Brocadiales bacterium]|nr:cytochrome c [Candidatus Bathyanammoxibius amoris]